jgi:hypothetical protein
MPVTTEVAVGGALD